MFSALKVLFSHEKCKSLKNLFCSSFSFFMLLPLAISLSFKSYIKVASNSVLHVWIASYHKINSPIECELEVVDGCLKWGLAWAFFPFCIWRRLAAFFNFSQDLFKDVNLSIKYFLPISINPSQLLRSILEHFQNNLNPFSNNSFAHMHPKSFFLLLLILSLLQFFLKI